MAKKTEKGRYNFLISSGVYNKFSEICDTQGYVRSKQVELLMKQFIQKNKK